MVKKELTNKKVVRAIALGLSAVMLTTPMTAMAHEAPVVDPDAGTTEVDKKINVTDGVDTTNAEIQNVEGLVENAQQSTTDAGITLKDDNTAVVGNAKDAAVEAGKVNDTTLDIKDGENDLTVNYGAVADKEETANEHLDNVEEELVILDQAAEALDKAADSIDTDIADAEELMGTLDQSVEDANNVAADAEAALNAAQDTTATEDEVKEAIASAATAVEKAETVAADAEKALEEAKAELDAAQKAADKAQLNYKLAQSTLGVSQEEIDAAQKAAQEAEKYASLLKDDVDAKQAAFEEAEKDALNLAKLQQAMYDQANSIKKIYDENSTVNDPDEGKLFDKETASGAYWDAAREYFKAYMQYVFDGIYGKGNVSYEWKKGSYSYGDDKYYTAGGNAYIIKYTVEEDGETKEITRYFNYHTTDFDGNIAIYEKFEGSKDEIKIDAEEGQEEKYEYVLVDNKGDAVKNDDDSYNVHDEENADIFVDVPATDSEATDSRWVADKESADTVEVSFADNQEVGDTITSGTPRIEVVPDYDNIIGYEEAKDVEDTDETLIRSFWNPDHCKEVIDRYVANNEGGYVTVTYNIRGVEYNKTFDNKLDWKDVVEFFGVILDGGEYEVTYYKQEAAPIYGTKTVIVVDSFATVTTTTETVENLDDAQNEAFDLEQELVSEGYQDITTAEEVAIAKGNEEVKERYSQYLNDEKYEVTVTPVKEKHGNTYTYTITVIEKVEEKEQVSEKKPSWKNENKAKEEAIKHLKDGQTYEITKERKGNEWKYGYKIYKTTTVEKVIVNDNKRNGSYKEIKVDVDPVYKTIATAKERAEAAAKAEVEEYIANGYLDAEYTLVELENGQYTYKITGTKTTYTTTDSTELVSTTTYDATAYKYWKTQEYKEAVEGVYVPAKNWWYEDRVDLGDKAVKDAMDNATAKRNALELQKKAAADAFEAAQKALRDVDAAREALQNLKVGESFADALQNLKDAYAKYEEAKEKLATINAAKDNAEAALALAEAELERFVVVPPAGGQGGNDSGDDTTPAGTPAGTPAATPVATPVVLADAPVAPAPVAVAAAGAGQAVVNIDDEATPLAAGINDADANGGDDEVIIAEANDDEQAIVAIEDEEIPLAAGVGADAKMSWWWLLIVALFGAAGYKMYKDHQKKKEEGQEA